MKTAPSNASKPRKHSSKPKTLPNMERIAELAKPRVRVDRNTIEQNCVIKRSALRYRASRRIKDLADPLWIMPKFVNRKKRKTGLVSNVNPKALKYKVTERIIELSLPKGWSYG